MDESDASPPAEKLRLEARLAVASALAAREPAPEASVGRAAQYYFEDWDSTTGWLLALVAAVFEVIHLLAPADGLVSDLAWTLVVLFAAVFALASMAGLVASFRAMRRHSRRIKIGTKMEDAVAAAFAGGDRTQAVDACRESIARSTPYFAARGTMHLFGLVAGQDHLDSELARPGSLVVIASWFCSAWRAEVLDGDTETALEGYAEVFSSQHPFWATAAAVKSIPLLESADQHALAHRLVGWIATQGHVRLAAELFHTAE